MDALKRVFGTAPARTSPPPVETDDVYPVHMLDDTGSLRGIVVTWTLRFNDVLDADKLHASLSRLLDIGDWRKVGGRLRLKDNGELEIYVPRPFTAERPAVTYSHQALAMGIEDHPLAKTLPKATETASIQAGPADFRAFAAREGAPETLEDFVYSDTPQLSLHITSFHDATLVALSWPHTLMDVMGQQALLHAWALVVAGREADVPPMLGAREDAVCAAVDASAEKEEFKMGRLRLKGWAMLVFGLRFAWDLLWNQVVETRSVYLPRSVVAGLRRQAEDDMVAADGGGKPFVSDGDVLTAWATRCIASALPQPRPVTLLHVVNARFRLPSLIQAPGVFVQNMAVAAFTFLSPDVATGPLGPSALENRRHLMEQATEGQILAFLRELQGESKAGSDPSMVCGESDALLIPFTNWTRAGIFKTADFAAAVVRAGETGPTRTNAPGTIVFHHAQSMRTTAVVRNVVVLLGKDHDDGCWMTGVLLPATWAKFEEEIKKM
ncbi:hypothetical protein QQZ08_005069 [Neonectria magnoliae]|uniref:Uncharacterized protein n=1 Tax=Neonectria magnoliae TaxID=2732573 RepID=A0ABR1I629_9HYPO